VIRAAESDTESYVEGVTMTEERQSDLEVWTPSVTPPIGIDLTDEERPARSGSWRSMGSPRT
jgi:hypothetical protein